MVRHRGWVLAGVLCLALGFIQACVQPPLQGVREELRLAASLTDEARRYFEQGRYVEAEPLYQRALAIREKSLGTEHLEVAATLDSLADLYQAQGKYAEAEASRLRAQAIREKSKARLEIKPPAPPSIPKIRPGGVR